MCDIRNIFLKSFISKYKRLFDTATNETFKNKINHNYNDTHEVLGTEQGLYTKNLTYYLIKL